MEIKPKLTGPEILRVEAIDASDAFIELQWLTPILEIPEDSGTARDDNGTPLKDNMGVFFSKVYTPKYALASPTAKLCEEVIKTCKTINFDPKSVFNYFQTMEGFDPLFSAYRNGDYYKAHRDEAKLTLLLWIGEKNFTGGDLYFPDFDFLVPFEPNTGLIFPSHYQHEVTKVETEQDGYVRFVVSAFIN